MVKQITTGDIFPLGESQKLKAPYALVELIHACLVKNPAERPQAQDIVKKLVKLGACTQEKEIPEEIAKREIEIEQKLLADFVEEERKLEQACQATKQEIEEKQQQVEEKSLATNYEQEVAKKTIEKKNKSYLKISILLFLVCVFFAIWHVLNTKNIVKKSTTSKVASNPSTTSKVASNPKSTTSKVASKPKNTASKVASKSKSAKESKNNQVIKNKQVLLEKIERIKKAVEGAQKQELFIKEAGFLFLRFQRYSRAGKTHNVKTYKHQNTNMRFILIPGGTFKMGSNEDSRERPVHKVVLNSFLISKYEVTQETWQKIMKNNPSKTKRRNGPVENVSWKDAQEFCQKEGFDLPTEAQWEYACRAQSPYCYYWGNRTSSLREYAWAQENSGRKLQPVGQKNPNAFGLYDMAGNVREWCQDWFDKYQKEESLDPVGALHGHKRVVRGGGFLDQDVEIFGISFREFVSPQKREEDLGFRVVKNLPKSNAYVQLWLKDSSTIIGKFIKSDVNRMELKIENKVKEIAISEIIDIK